MNFRNYTFRCLLAMTLLYSGMAANAQKESTMKNDYSFLREETPLFIEPYATTVFSAGASRVNTMRGDLLNRVGKNKEIADFKVSPAGNTFAIIEKSLKSGESKARIMSTVEAYKTLHVFDTKKYGMASAIAYTPNARYIILATDTGLFIFDARKYDLVGKIEGLGMTPTSVVFSPNGYFLALVEGKDAIIINFEAKKVRKRIDAEVEVTDVTFSGNSQLMALLTSDGLLNVYDTRTFDVRTIIDGLGEGLSCSFTNNGKYIAVAVNPSEIEVINLVRTSDRRTYNLEETGLSVLEFISDFNNNALLTYNSDLKLNARRMHDLEPYYNRLVSETVDGKMNEWLKMQPGETLEEYNKRVNDQTRAAQRRLFEDEISTMLAGDMLAMSQITLGKYDRANELLEVGFSNLPTILLPVAETDMAAFTSGNDLTVQEAQYGLLADDTFELIYAKFYNKNDGKTYIFDNIDRRPMDLLTNDANFVSLDILRQQQMEEIALQEIRKKVVDEARHNNVISDHTNIAIDSKVQPDYDAEGNKILNYIVKVTYEVEPEFSATEDFAPGKYHVEESGAASSMLKIVKEAFEGDMKQYLKPGKKIKVTLSGTADATPILHGIPYDGSYGDFEEEPILVDGVLTPLTVTKQSGIRTNPQLALLRAAGVKDFLQKNINVPEGMNVEYDYEVGVSQDKGSEHRRITAQFNFIDAF